MLALRADNGFAFPALYDYCEDHEIEYFVNVGTDKMLITGSGRSEIGRQNCLQCWAGPGGPGIW